MRSPIGRRIIRPKISTMPRQKNQATAYLQIYQLAVEKKRLQEELQAIENRKFNISKRLETIVEQIDLLEQAAHEMDSDSSTEATDSQGASPNQSSSQSPKKSDQTNPDSGYTIETMTLDY